MSRVTLSLCDRCEAELGPNKATAPGYGVSLTVGYHHPQKLDLCLACEKEFTIWLGKHPLWGTKLETIAAGAASGDGCPSPEQARAALDG